MRYVKKLLWLSLWMLVFTYMENKDLWEGFKVLF